MDFLKYVGISAFGISLFNTVWNILTWHSTRSRRLSVIFATFNNVEINGEEAPELVGQNFMLQLTNRGGRALYILLPQIEFKGGRASFPVNDFENKYPIELNHGQSKIIYYNRNKVMEWIRENRKTDYLQVRFVVYDTLGKKYKSNWRKYGEL